MLYLGTNVGHTPIFRAADIRLAGVNLVRFVLQAGVDLRPYIQELKAVGITPLGVIARESFAKSGGWDTRGFDASSEMSYQEAATYYSNVYKNYITHWQIGNEADHVSPSSWNMSPPQLNELLNVFITTIKSTIPGAQCIGPGLVSGDPNYLNDIELAGLDGIAVHPYAKYPTNVAGFLNEYARFNVPLWVTEFGWPEPNEIVQAVWVEGMVKAMSSLVICAAMYCWDDIQNPHFGAVKNGQPKAAYYSLQRVGFSATPPTPAPVAPYYVLGFEKGYNANPALIGAPLELERGGIPGLSFQLTTRGFLTAAKLEGRGWTITFYETSTRRRYLLARTEKTWELLP